MPGDGDSGDQPRQPVGAHIAQEQLVGSRTDQEHTADTEAANWAVGTSLERTARANAGAAGFHNTRCAPV